MNREQFEQLVSQWLDEPRNEDLRARIESAAAQSDDLARLREQWQRLDGLVRQAVPSTRDVDWGMFRQRLAREIDRAAGQPDDQTTPLDGLLRAQTDVADRVDWERFGRRVAASATVARRRSVGRTVRRVVLGVALTAAAVLAFVALRLPERHQAPRGFAIARVVPAGVAVAHLNESKAFASVAVHAPEGAERVEAGPTTSMPPSAELFLVISPVAQAGTADRPAVFQNF